MVPVDKRVFKNVKIFMEKKKDGDDLFDRLNTSVSLASLQYDTVVSKTSFGFANVKLTSGAEPVSHRSHGRFDRQSVQVHWSD